MVCVMIEVNSVMYIYLDHCACFGCSSSNGLFGRPGNAIVTIFAYKGVKDTLCWADDFVFFQYPLPSSSASQFSFPFNKSLIFSIVEDLGWPWSPSKHIPFASSFPYLGFIWNLSNKSVSIPLSKCEKYLAHLEAWVPGAYVSLRDVQGVLGCLQHCTLVLSDGCSHLPSFYRFCSAFKAPTTPLSNTIFPKTPSLMQPGGAPNSVQTGAALQSPYPPPLSPYQSSLMPPPLLALVCHWMVIG